MLQHLTIQNYTIVESLDIELAGGMSVITGETGAGKSIMLDALGLCLGDRADPKTVREGASKADITASFDIATITEAQQWLQSRDLDMDGNCMLRRVITQEGRSRAYINGQPATLQDVKSLGECLIDIHSQHAHQSLLRRETQRKLLDNYAGNSSTVDKVASLANQWQLAQDELEQLQGAQGEQGARQQLLAYQVDELEQLSLGKNELKELEAEQKQLANAENILASGQQALDLCEADGGAIDSLQKALQLLSDDNSTSKTTASARELLDSARIQVDEARTELKAHLDQVNIDPEKLNGVEIRLNEIYDIARKHKIMPEQLLVLFEQLNEELQRLKGSESRVLDLQASLEKLQNDYKVEADKLSKQRTKAAKTLSKKVESQLQALAMEQCRIKVELRHREDQKPHNHGQEDIEFLISTNPGQEPQALSKIASGGELSRISLAIEVITAQTSTTPSMVFDEVDVGIGGAVAEVVGKLLRTLSDGSQILCVTHLAQVAAQGHQHIRVEKTTDKKATFTRLAHLDDQQKVEEIARMLGGIKVTKQTRSHAEEMLGTAANA
jgi:DNA repair protein RecN (Recombination protein N)